MTQPGTRLPDVVAALKSSQRLLKQAQKELLERFHPVIVKDNGLECRIKANDALLRSIEEGR